MPLVGKCNQSWDSMATGPAGHVGTILGMGALGASLRGGEYPGFSQPIESRYRAPIGAEGRIELGGLHLCDRRNRHNRVNISVKFLVVGSCGNLGRGVEKVQEVEVRGSNPGLAVFLAQSSAAFWRV